MGSDTSPAELFPAVIQAAQEWGREATFLVLAAPGTIVELKEQLKGSSVPDIRFQTTEEVISMGDEPIEAVRQKKNSSLVRGVRLLRKKKIDALVTTGNTGALITAASLLLTKTPGIRRPALLAALPSAKGFVSVIDVGGNVQCKASLLYQYAILGSRYHRQAYGIDIPQIGLLNIGNESKKGTLEHQEAFRLLSGLSGFRGNVEGREVFSGEIDVLVTDGFTGNVLLKTAEGVAALIFETLSLETPASLRKEVCRLYHKFNWSDYPGALVMGVEGILIKCHGSSSAPALLSGLKGAVRLCRERDLV